MKKIISLFLCANIALLMFSNMPAKAVTSSTNLPKPIVKETSIEKVVITSDQNGTYIATYNKQKNTMRLETLDKKTNKVKETQILDYNVENDIVAPTLISTSSYYYVVATNTVSPLCGLYYKCADVGNGNYKWYIQSINSSVKTKIINGSNNFGRFDNFKTDVDNAASSFASAMYKTAGAVLAAIAPYIKSNSAETLMSTPWAKVAALCIACSIALSAVGDAQATINSCGSAQYNFNLI